MPRRNGIYGSFQVETAAESQLLTVGLGRGCANSESEAFTEYQFIPPLPEAVRRQILKDDRTPWAVRDLFDTPADREEAKPNSTYVAAGEPCHQHLLLAICAMQTVLDHTGVSYGVVKARLGLRAPVENHVVAELSDHI